MREYKAVQLAPMLIKDKKSTESATKHVENLINQYAREGWLYHSMETISEARKAGCLGGSIDPQSKISYYVVIFERETR